jgi:hypothetical protein
MVSVADLVAHEAARDEAARAERMRGAWAAYTGDTPRPLRVRPGEYDDNVRVNFARLIVDRGVSFLFGGDVGIRVEGPGADRAGSWLDAVWRENRKAGLLHRLAVNGGVCGHAFVRIVPGMSGLPRLVALDPMTVSVQWRPDDWEQVVAYRIQWHGIEPATGRPRAYRQIVALRGRGWDITDQESEGDDARWNTVRSVAWPYAWPPIVACQNLPSPNEYWGFGDLEEDVLGVCRAMNFVLSNAMRIVRLHAHPKLWGSGFRQEDLELGPSDVTVLPDAGSSLHLLEMHGDLGPSLELFARLRESLHATARLPDTGQGGGAPPSGRLTGVAIRMLHQPIVEKTQTKRTLYGEMLIELSRRLLAMAGFGGDLRVNLEWPAVTPTDPLEEAQTALAHRQLGAEAGPLLRRLGLDDGERGSPCPTGST